MSTSSSASEQVVVVQVPEQGRFEIHVDGVTAGFTEYVDAGDERTFPHTLVREEFGGRGLATRLIGEALDATRAAGLGVVPRCSAVRHFIERHPDHLDLVPPARRAEVGL